MTGGDDLAVSLSHMAMCKRTVDKGSLLDAAYAVGSRVLTKYSSINDVDVSYELFRECKRDETNPIEKIIVDAEVTTSNFLIPKGLPDPLRKVSSRRRSSAAFQRGDRSVVPREAMVDYLRRQNAESDHQELGRRYWARHSDTTTLDRELQGRAAEGVWQWTDWPRKT